MMRSSYYRHSTTITTTTTSSSNAVAATSKGTRRFMRLIDPYRHIALTVSNTGSETVLNLSDLWESIRLSSWK